MTDTLAIAACACPACGTLHSKIATEDGARQGTLARMFAAEGTRGMIAVCSACGAFVWYNGAVMDLCDDLTVARIVPPHLLPRIRELAERVRAKRAN